MIKALIIGADRRHYRTEDAGATWQAVTTPTRPFTLNGNALRFHSTRQRHMLFLGRDCAANDVDCHVAAYYTIDAGSQWILARRYVLDCQWGHANKYFQTPASVDTMFCVEWPYKKGEQRWMSPDDLVATTSTDFYRRSSRTLTFDDGQQSGVMGVGVVDRFMLIAVVWGGRCL